MEIASKWIAIGYNASLVLRILELKPSTYYYSISRNVKEIEESGGRPIPGYSYTSDGRKVYDMQIKEWIMELIEGDCFAYGYYKLTIALRKEYKLIINKKKVYRLCKELGILKHQREIKQKHPRRLARNRIVTAPNQLW
jgi:putative transposase